jgi:adenylate cyclase
VLPFESLSENKNDSYFADGVQDEILANVARVSQLKVISRTSVMQYRADVKRDIRQIANALGVANILEGTVRRAANRVRITIELVDARTDQTLWSESYDRDLTDIFAIQSEVAQRIASRLTATLSPEEKKKSKQSPPRIWKRMTVICGPMNYSPKFVFLIVGQHPGSRCSMRLPFWSKRFNSIRSLR